MVVIKEKYNIETIESNGLDKNILRKKGNAKTYSGWLIQRIKEARETNFETAIFLQELYNKYMEFEKTEKIKIKRRKCPACGSTKIQVSGNTFYCKKCGFINREVIIERRKK